jgi:ADP-dependent NAD(P)H-hydrate dehydratase
VRKHGDASIINRELLRRSPLPRPERGGDKEERGRVLVVGGGPETPGAVVLAATAALRAGAGKVQIATGRGNAPAVAACVPEARVFALPESRAGSLTKAAMTKLEKHLSAAQAVCLGPGLIEDAAVARFSEAALEHCRGAALVMDAGALCCLARGRELLHAFGGRAVITPNADEMADIFGVDKESLTRDPAASALRAARELRAVVVLKGRVTFVASPEGKLYENHAGNVGLATSGSGDVLAGLVAGLAARGAEALTAAAWGVHLHALAGERLAERVAPLGYLARELPAEVPRLMSELGGDDE